MILAISLFCILGGLLSFMPSIRWRPETFAPIYFFGFALSCLGFCLFSANVSVLYSILCFLLLFAAYLILPILKTKPKVLLLCSGLISISPYLLYGDSFDFHSFKVLFTHNGVVFLPFLTWILITISDVLLPKIIQRFFCNQEQEIESIVLSAVITITGFIGFFFGQYFGLILVVFGALLAIHGGKKRDFSYAYLLLALLLLFACYSSLTRLLNNPEFVIYVAGQSVMSVFAAITLLFTYHHIQKTSALSLSIIIGIALFILVLIPLAGLQKEDIGGPIYVLFLLLFLGPIVAVWQIGKDREYLPLLMLVFGTSLLILPKFALENVSMNNEIGLKNPEKIVSVVSFDQLPNLKPSFNIGSKNELLSDSSLINFDLGNAPSITKGTFKNWSGTITMVSNSLCELKIELPLIGMSTNNKYRDESLMSKGYFDKLKTPKITFDVAANLESNNTFTGIGNLKMGSGKGKVEVQFKIIKETATHVYIAGKLEVDRTKYGMLSDPKIGDIVRVNVATCIKK